jgi:hypothetical protein
MRLPHRRSGEPQPRDLAESRTTSTFSASTSIWVSPGRSAWEVRLCLLRRRLGISDRYGHNLEVGIRFGDQDATRLDPVPILQGDGRGDAPPRAWATRSTTYDQPYHRASLPRSITSPVDEPLECGHIHA